MNLNDFTIELEHDITWRSTELRRIENQLNVNDEDAEYDVARKAALLLLYSHLEGFFYLALCLYTRYINEMQLKCREVKHHIIALALSRLFKEMRNPNKNVQFFKEKLPDDSHMHRFKRDVEFLERIDEFLDKEVKIPLDVINTENNLGAQVIRKNLFFVGLEPELFSEHYVAINKLLRYRNDIAHGRYKDGISHSQYDEMKHAVFTIMSGISNALQESINQNHFYRI